jgi:hypothetical protein
MWLVHLTVSDKQRMRPGSELHRAGTWSIADCMQLYKVFYFDPMR